MKNNFDISDFVNVDTLQMVKKNLVERVKNKRKKMKISQKKLAEKSGVTYASIRRFESMGEISLTSLLKIAEALNSLSDFNDLFSHITVTSLKDL